MDFKQAWLDGTDILAAADSGIIYTRRDWLGLSTTDDSFPVSGNDGRRASRTYARIRTITLEGIVERTENPNELSSVRHLENLFALDAGIREFKVLDAYDRAWTLAVKVSEPLSIVEGDETITGSYWRWRVRLESVSDPSYRASEATVSSGGEGVYGGIVFPMSFPARFDRYHDAVSVQNDGNVRVPVRVEITAADPSVYSFGEDLVSGDPNAWTRILLERYGSSPGGRTETGNIGGYWYPTSNPYQYVESAGGMDERWISWKLPNRAGSIVREFTLAITAYDPVARHQKAQWSTDNIAWTDLAFSGDGLVTTSWTVSPDAPEVYVRLVKEAGFDAVFNFARLTVSYAVTLVRSPLTIRNVTDGTKFALDIDALPGDRIVVDSEVMRAYKNGEDVTAARLPGSSFPTAERGTTKFLVFDRDGGFGPDDLTVSASIRNALL